MQINNNFRSPNYSPRVKKIEYIILHYTEMPFEAALSKLIDATSAVSCHYLIRKDGEIFNLVEDDKIAWHAGESSWQNSVKLNQNSIGIELDNLGNSKFSQEQMKSCIDLCQYLVSLYHLNPEDIIGHSDIAPNRKIDPGIFFDWQLLAKHNLGKWHDIAYSEDLKSQPLLGFEESGHKVLELQQRLHKLGYKIEQSGQFDTQTSKVIRAFQAHFCPEIIHHKHGIEFYKNLDSIYSWDGFSEAVLQELVGGKYCP
jgi:N-acetylmuramoyl-L-alanine amidase